ncbi:MAG: FprA family A-type flavoprotein, partial [Nanoarchaeota archaeon]
NTTSLNAFASKMEAIKEGIYWVGSDNPEGRNFHGISTPRGGSYNSYLIQDEQSVIIDGEDQPFIDRYLKDIKEQNVDYLIVNHAEPDHTGALNQIIKELGCIVVCTAKGREFLEAMGISGEFKVVEDGDELSIGSRTLNFVSSPMVHWPETMMTYIKEDSILFSGDLFGTEISHEALFADEYEDFSELIRDYFALIMRPVNAAVKNAIVKAKELNPSFIAPTHGPVHRDLKIIEHYEKLSNKPEENKVTVFYSSIWQGTEEMAEEIIRGVKETGAEAKSYDITKTNFVTLMAEALTSKSVALGSLTMLGGYHPLFEGLFPLFKMNRQEKTALVFGTHGWVPASVPMLNTKAEELGWNVLGNIDFRFGRGDYTKLREAGKKLGGL